jgi:hypothetical protein
MLGNNSCLLSILRRLEKDHLRKSSVQKLFAVNYGEAKPSFVIKGQQNACWMCENSVLGD